MRFQPEDRKDITSIVSQLTTLSRQEPGCVTYVPLWVEGEDADLVIWEQYQDEAAVEFHRQTPHFAQFAVGGLYQKMLERSVEDLHAVA